MNFTIHNDEYINSKIKDYLYKIGKELSSYFPIKALILYGAFGRGEGRVLIFQKKINIINDLDIIAVVDDEFYNEVISKWRELSVEFQKKTKFFLDIKFQKLSSLKNLPFTMDNYDIKNGSYVFFGEKNILNMIPDYNVQAMPKNQGRRLLLNRLVTFLEARFSFIDEDIENKKAVFCNYQTSKVVFACVDAYLILNCCYTTKYYNKYLNFNKLKKYTEYSNLVKKALSIKVGPDPIPDVDCIEFWELTGHFYLETILNFLYGEKDLKLVLKGKGLLKDIYDNQINKNYKYWIKHILKRNYTYRQYLETINLLMLFSLFKDNKYNKILSNVIITYSKKYNIVVPDMNINDYNIVCSFVLGNWYNKLHYGISTYDLWKNEQFI